MTAPLQTAAVTLIIAGGALLQGTVGFGMGLFSVPFLALISPTLVPGPTLFASGVLTVLMLARERSAIRAADLGWSLTGRLVGTLLGLGVLVLVPTESLGIVFGVLIIGACLLTASGLHVAPTARTLSVAGTLSGFMATTVSIGGPPMAILYQREDGPSLRSTLSAFFVVGTVVSLLGLHLVGKFGWVELAQGMALIPGIVIGFAVSRWTAPWLDKRALRPAILLVSGLTGAVVLIESVW